MENFNQEPAVASNKMAAAMSPEIFMRNWQQTGVRVLRAQERLLNGIVNAAKMEVQFGQEMMANRLAFIKGENDAPQAGTDRTMQEVERMLGVFRDVTEELRNGFREATKLLMEGADPQMKEAAEKASAMFEDTAHKTEDMMEKTVHSSTEMTQQHMAEAQETVSNSQMSPGYGGEHPVGQAGTAQE